MDSKNEGDATDRRLFDQPLNKQTCQGNMTENDLSECSNQPIQEKPALLINLKFDWCLIALFKTQEENLLSYISGEIKNS